MDRRKFLLLSLASGGTLTIGHGFLAPAFAAPAEPGDSPYGPLGAADDLGLRLPDGFTSRTIKQFGLPIAGLVGLDKVGLPFPDGAATFATDDGGWILVSNSENPPPADITDPTPIGLDQLGGAQAIRFSSDGTITDAYSILSGTRSNCAGGETPWGTWLSCEEVDDPNDAANSGLVYECDPIGATPAVALPLLGRFKHENATIDPVRNCVYQSEDISDGFFYRFTPTAYPDLTAGILEAAVVADDGSVTWLEISDPACAGGTPCRRQVDATTFDGGEGCVYDDGKVFLTTKGDDRVWMFDADTDEMTILYDASDFADPVLTGVDHIIVQPGTGNLVIAEDGGDLEAVMIRRSDFAVFPVLQMTGPQHFELVGSPVVSEVSGLAFNPTGDRLYFNSQRAFGGITYEVTGPWSTALQEDDTTTTTGSTSTTTLAPTTTAAPAAGATLPATGGSDLGPLALGAGALAAGLVALRQRLDRQLPDEMTPETVDGP
ncbi:MAG: DUF839 domain-containing protein [Acidimicrobiales bacterium]|nr:DUF839 domain-containing protein [Acidimicrobiales bacterium]